MSNLKAPQAPAYYAPCMKYYRKLYQPVQEMLNSVYGYNDEHCTMPCVSLSDYREGVNQVFEYDEWGYPESFTYTGYEEFITCMFKVIRNGQLEYMRQNVDPLMDLYMSLAEGPCSIIYSKPVPLSMCGAKEFSSAPVDFDDDLSFLYV